MSDNKNSNVIIDKDLRKERIRFGKELKFTIVLIQRDTISTCSN